MRSYSIIEQTLAALDFAHGNGFVHRDIKEQNILVDGNFPDFTAKLTDFGLSKSYQADGYERRDDGRRCRGYDRVHAA